MGGGGEAGHNEDDGTLRTAFTGTTDQKGPAVRVLGASGKTAAANKALHIIDPVKPDKMLLLDFTDIVAEVTSGVHTFRKTSDLFKGVSIKCIDMSRVQCKVSQ